MVIIKKLSTIFALSFALNFMWEHLHSVLYLSYKGGAITNSVLARATLADAIFITLIAAPFLISASLRRRLWIGMLGALVLAVAIERYALATGRWRYAPAMPLIPVLGTGLSPTIQLALLFAASFLISEMLWRGFTARE